MDLKTADEAQLAMENIPRAHIGYVCKRTATSETNLTLNDVDFWENEVKEKVLKTPICNKI